MGCGVGGRPRVREPCPGGGRTRRSRTGTNVPCGGHGQAAARRIGGGEVTKIVAGDGTRGDYFGWSVSISGDAVIVGAYHDYDDGAGSAYVFQRNWSGADDWGQVTKIAASDATGGGSFGFSVSVSGDQAIVGAMGNDAAGRYAGAMYVFFNGGGTGDCDDDGDADLGDFACYIDCRTGPDGGVPLGCGAFDFDDDIDVDLIDWGAFQVAFTGDG